MERVTLSRGGRELGEGARRLGLRGGSMGWGAYRKCGREWGRRVSVEEKSNETGEGEGLKKVAGEG